jgi:hypothetical protein
MKSDIVYFIIAHHPQIIEYSESIGKYELLKNRKYLLVGQHSDDYSSDIVIQCDRLPNNI